MATVYPRGKKLWCAYHDADGERHSLATPYAIGQEELAKRFAEEMERGARSSGPVALGPMTVKRYAAEWTKARTARGIDSAKVDLVRLQRHALATIGALRIDEVRPRHVRDLIHQLRARCGSGDDQLAPRTVRHVAAVLHTMFADAVVDELLPSNPAVFKRGDLPKKADKDPGWRAGAIFTREEVELLLSSDTVPADRRMFYAVMFLTGCRFGEVAALRWRAYDPTRKPLGHLHVAYSFNSKTKQEKSTKTELAREVPVHALLAKMLAEWRMTGWRDAFGRAPTAEDLIVPSRTLQNRKSSHSWQKFTHDLEQLGMRRRRLHDARRTFITLARTDGARKDILEAVTHGPRGDIMSAYTSLPWNLLCEEVAKLKIERRTGEIIRLPMVVNGDCSSDAASNLLQLVQATDFAEKKDWRWWESNTQNQRNDAEARGNSPEKSSDTADPTGNERNEAPSDCSSVAADTIDERLAAMARVWSDTRDVKRLLHLARSLVWALRSRGGK